MFVQHFRLIRGVLTRCISVQRATEGLQRECQLLGAALWRAFEHHVLQHMRDAHFLGRFMERGSANPCPESDRPYSRHVFREYGQPVRQNGAAQISACGLRSEDHSRERPPPFLPRPPRERRGLSPRSPRSDRSGRSSLSPPSLPSPPVSAPTAASAGVAARSEEHTSELQSPCNL